ncbi:unnamed protein product [Prorocentrum cordatum]|uniref:Peptidase M16 middle/third domain-containing protein n=1 Tax=Prorocentrum cordatum TaxID=2364126 RepID=A0ABN9V012_9DINO|nr:unnamed protein product [Polarella glacialis]
MRGAHLTLRRRAGRRFVRAARPTRGRLGWRAALLARRLRLRGQRGSSGGRPRAPGRLPRGVGARGAGRGRARRRRGGPPDAGGLAALPAVQARRQGARARGPRKPLRAAAPARVGSGPGSRGCGGPENETFALIKVSVDLTPAGFECRDEVLQLLFGYVRFLRELPEWPRELLEESVLLSEANWRSSEQPEATDAVLSLAGSMQKCQEPRDYLLRTAVLEGGPGLPRAVASCVRALTPGNALVTVVSRDFRRAAVESEKWYGTRFQTQPAATLRAAWEEARAAPGLALPSPNPFVPRSLELKAARQALVPRGAPPPPPEVLRRDGAALARRDGGGGAGERGGRAPELGSAAEREHLQPHLQRAGEVARLRAEQAVVHAPLAGHRGVIAPAPGIWDADAVSEGQASSSNELRAEATVFVPWWELLQAEAQEFVPSWELASQETGRRRAHTRRAGRGAATGVTR